MQKEVLFGKDAREKLLSGAQKITNAVKVTMGAMGKCVLIGEAYYGDNGLTPLKNKVTKDGWTVTKYFQLPDPIEQRGAMMIAEAATKTMEEAGDSTTLTCVLAESLITSGMELIENGVNSQLIKKELDAALVYVIDELKKISIPVRGDNKRIKQIATVSANNDTEIGQLIADAYLKIGDDGVIDIEESKGVRTEIKITDGIKFDKGWVSNAFVNNRAKETCEFIEPLILLYEKRITHHTQIIEAVKVASENGRPLLIICEDADEEGLAFLAMNNLQKRVMVCVVKSPEFGDNRREYMEDIAMITGATYISDTKGVDIKNITIDELGEAKKIVVSKTETIIIEGMGNPEIINDFVNDLKMNLVQTETEELKYPIEKRIARLTGGVAVIYVGAATEVELREKMDRVDDAVRATKSAIAEGFVAGGGSSLLNINTKFHLMNHALISPIKQICENAGVKKDIIDMFSFDSNKNIGYNVLTNKMSDMISDGIIDSTKAIRCALTNAVSVAGMVLTSECVIITTQ